MQSGDYNEDTSVKQIKILQNIDQANHSRRINILQKILRSTFDKVGAEESAYARRMKITCAKPRIILIE